MKFITKINKRHLKMNQELSIFFMGKIHRKLDFKIDELLNEEFDIFRYPFTHD